MKVAGRWIRCKRALMNAKHAAYNSVFLPFGGTHRVARTVWKQLEVTRHRVILPELPKAFDGITVLHLSDLHLGPLFDEAHQLRDLIRLCRELEPHAIVVTGDWVEDDPEPLRTALPLLDQVRPPLGWFGVLGNHDAHLNRWRTLRLLREWLGERLLVNQCLRVELDDDAIEVIGMDFSTGGRRLARSLVTLRSVREQPSVWTLALFHYPDLFEPLARSQRVDLALAGHTHGGQITWNRAPEPPRGLVAHQFRYCRGWYREDGAQLYVNRGLGGTVPFRLNCPPEAALMTLARS